MQKATPDRIGDENAMRRGIKRGRYEK